MDLPLLAKLDPSICMVHSHLEHVLHLAKLVHLEGSLELGDKHLITFRRVSRTDVVIDIHQHQDHEVAGVDVVQARFDKRLTDT